nr:group II intron maturase-specific domain-containing protein [Bradyrhizobium sacchari]
MSTTSRIIRRARPVGESYTASVTCAVTEWRNHYRYASGASSAFSTLDWWLWQRVGRWLKKKPRASVVGMHAPPLHWPARRQRGMGRQENPTPDCDRARNASAPLAAAGQC